MTDNTDDPDVKKGAIAIQVCENLDSLTAKLEQEQKKLQPNLDLIKKFMFHANNLKRFLAKIQSPNWKPNPRPAKKKSVKELLAA